MQLVNFTAKSTAHQEIKTGIYFRNAARNPDGSATIPYMFFCICDRVAAGGDTMKELLLLIGFLAFWIVLQKYILPRLGIST
jgi:hypothetical protein